MRGLFAPQDLWIARNAVSRKSVNDNQIQPGQRNSIAARVRALTSKNPSNTRRRDVRPSLIQRIDPATLRSRLYFCPIVYNPWSYRSPVEAKDRNEAKEILSARRHRIRLARFLSRGISWAIAGDLPEPAAGISQISGLMAPSWCTRPFPRKISILARPSAKPQV